jgi:membrane associated rhomboid family serine protease
VFVPVYDINPLRRIRFQYVTVGLIALNVLVFLLFQVRDLYLTGDECAQVTFTKAFGIIPLQLLGIPVSFSDCPDGALSAFNFPAPLTLLTYMFLHGSIWHLVGNMLFLWVFGDNVEDALGHVRFLIFYLVCGIAGGLLYFATQLNSTSPLIGASGAIAGVVAAYVMLSPHVHLWVLVLRIIPLQLPAYWAIGAWIAMNLFLAVSGLDSGIAWWAHIGGIITGAILVVFMRQRGVPLFARPVTGG